MLQTGTVDSGAWFYPGDPLADDRAEVRFLVGDTQSTDQLLSDEEINATLRMSERNGRPGGSCSTPVLAVVGTTAAGAVLITLDATAVSGTLEPGDSFLIAGDATRYNVTTYTEAAGNVFTAVGIDRGLATAAADNAVVTLRFSNPYEAAALCCESLARRFAREADVTSDGRTVNFSQKSTAYRSLAKDLRQQASRAGSHFMGVSLVRA